ncbi:unnamed protein product [Eretmochelys imbricata]
MAKPQVPKPRGSPLLVRVPCPPAADRARAPPSRLSRPLGLEALDVSPSPPPAVDVPYGGAGPEGGALFSRAGRALLGGFQCLGGEEPGALAPGLWPLARTALGPATRCPPPAPPVPHVYYWGGGSVIWPVLLLLPHPLRTFKEDALGVDQESLQNAEPQCDLPGGQLQSGQFCRCFRLALWEGNSSLSVPPPPPPPMVKYLSIGSKVGS